MLQAMRPTDEQLLALSAAEAARQIVRGTISSESLVGAAVNRAQARDPELQAWTHLDAPAALAEARQRDAHKPLGPLHGVPVAIKDLIDVSGMPTTNGSAIYRGNVPLADASCVALLRASGAVILGKTATVEFGASHPAPTRNPRNPAHTPGGSSSGSAAVVADTQVSIALGTQTGGSVIRPAAFCGIVGFKPSFGRLSLSGAKMCAWSLDTLGMLSRDIEDVALMFGVLSGDMESIGADGDRALTVGILDDPSKGQADSAAHAALQKASEVLEEREIRVSRLDAPAGFNDLRAAQRTIARFEMARSLAFEWHARRSLLSESTRRELEEGWSIPAADYLRAKARLGEVQPAFERLFQSVDCLMTFAAPGEAPRGLASTGSVMFNGVLTALGVPCLTLPVMEGPAGLPVGIQLVGGMGRDWPLLRAARQIEFALKHSSRRKVSAAHSLIWSLH